MFKHIRKLVTPIFEQSLKETSKNHMVVGRGRSDSFSFAFVQPHNYRSYFNYSRVSSLLDDLKESTGFIKTEGRLTEGGVGSVYYKKINHDKEVSFPDFCGCRVVVKKNNIEVVNKIDHKRWFSVRMHKDFIEEDMVKIAVLKDSQSLDVFKRFIHVMGLASDFVLVKGLVEAKVKGESSINNIPIDMHFHNEVAKTVYAEKNDAVKNVEFKSMGLASQYLVNRCKEDFIENKFEELRKEFMKSKELVSPLESVKMSISTFPDGVFANSESIVALSVVDKALLTDWLFEEFGGVV